jgi:arginine utilization protein RocB
MPATPSEVMSQTRRKETAMTLGLNPSESSKSRGGEERARCAPDSPQEVKDLTPYAAKEYSAKELKYLWTMWDEARRHHQPGQRHRNLFAGAVGVILTGWLIYGLGLSCSGPLGGILMLAGVLIGAWHYMKFRRRQRHSALER